MKTTLLLILFFCHFLADYTHLSTNWMLNAKRLGKPLLPIFCHALIHALLMALALEIYFTYKLPGYDALDFKYTIVDELFAFQLITHFLIDLWKGKMNTWFPSLQNPANKWHWVIFGADQYLHAIVIILMVAYC